MVKKAYALKPVAVSLVEDVDFDLGVVAKPYALIPPGVYDVGFGGKKPHSMRIFGGERLITYWLIQDLSSEYHGTELILGFEFPQEGKKWGTLSKMAQCIRIATGRDPYRYDTGRLSTRVFKHKLFSAQVRTVTEGNNPKGRKRQERSPESHYSVIETLLALKVG